MDRVGPFETIIQDVSALVAEELRAVGPELLTADLDRMETRLQPYKTVLFPNMHSVHS